MELNELRKKSASELDDHLGELRREQFNLRMQKALGPAVADRTSSAACVARSRASKPLLGDKK